MAESRELICDALAANAVAGRQRYARSLLRLATQFAARPHAVPAPYAIGIFDAHPFKNFERRVMNLTHHSAELRGAARFAATALSLALIGGACTSALAFRQQVAAPQTQTTASPPTANISPAPGDVGPANVDIATAPAGVGPSAIVIGVPHSANGQPKSFFKVDIPDASGPNPVVKVLTPTVVQTAQTTTHTNAVSTTQILPDDIAGNRDKYVEPVYPTDAKAAGIQGSVVLNAVIGKDGNIASLKLVSGPPELTKAAWDAVKQWTYKPYLLNGDPVAVDTTITVTFALAK
jgi:TonB family protein